MLGTKRTIRHIRNILHCILSFQFLDIRETFVTPGIQRQEMAASPYGFSRVNFARAKSEIVSIRINIFFCLASINLQIRKLFLCNN